MAQMLTDGDDLTVIILTGDEHDALGALLYGAAQAGLMDTLPQLTDLRRLMAREEDP